MLIQIGVFLLPYYCDKNSIDCTGVGSFDMMLYTLGTFWLITFFFDRLFENFFHKKKLFIIKSSIRIEDSTIFSTWNQKETAIWIFIVKPDWCGPFLY